MCSINTQSCWWRWCESHEAFAKEILLCFTFFQWFCFAFIPRFGPTTLNFCVQRNDEGDVTSLLVPSQDVYSTYFTDCPPTVTLVQGQTAEDVSFAFPAYLFIFHFNQELFFLFLTMISHTHQQRHSGDMYLPWPFVIWKRRRQIYIAAVPPFVDVAYHA